MAQALNTQKKLCKIMTNGPIADLGGIAGPILYPCKIDMRKIINMVHHGVVVVEVNPKNQNQTVRLTMQNVSKNNFPEPEKYILPETKVEKKEETPIVNKKDVAEAVQGNIVNGLDIAPELDARIAEVASDTTSADATPVIKTTTGVEGRRNDFNKKRR